MTRDDAIKEIDNLRNDIGSAYDDADQSPMWYALGMAIEALNARKSGVWKVYRDCEGKQTQYECPFCDMSATHFAWQPKYCDSCGARLTIPEWEEAPNEQ